MARRQKSDEGTVVIEETKVEETTEETAEETAEETGDKKKQEPLDPATLKPEAAKCLANGEDAKRKLEVAAEALLTLGLKGGAKRLWKDAERAYAAGEREARRVQKTGSKEEREAAKKEKKKEKIAKLREQLEKLMAGEAEAASGT